MGLVPPVSIRMAKPGDAPEIANVHLNAWREAYCGLLPQLYLDGQPLTFRQRSAWWEKVIGSPEAHALIVAESERGIVGFGDFEPGRDSRFQGYGEIGAIYLLAHFKRQGIGFELLATGFRKLRENGFEKAYCWVLDQNPTIGFYEKTGARFSGLKKEETIAGQLVTELAYTWESLSEFY